MSTAPRHLTAVSGPQSAHSPLQVQAVRLAPVPVTLPDGHQVGVYSAGRGHPLVLVHGFTAQSAIYFQMLSRIAGVRIITIDLASHGRSAPLAKGKYQLDAYVDDFGRILDALGIRQAMLVGHSLGGRVAAQYAATNSHRVSALILVNAIVGKPWDDLVSSLRYRPWRLAPLCAQLISDCLATVRGSAKLSRLALPMVAGNLVRLHQLAAPGLSILGASHSHHLLELLRLQQVPVEVIHSDRDPAVPLATAIDTAERTGGRLTVVHEAGHSWLIQDPSTFPVILKELLQGSLHQAFWSRVTESGRDPDTLWLEHLDREFLEPESPLLSENTPLVFPPEALRQLVPRFNWSSFSFEPS